LIAELVLLGIACFFWIGLRQWQNLNSVRRQYAWMVPTSLLIELAGVYYVVIVAHFGEVGWLFVVTGLGGGLGTMFFTWLHYRRKRD